jgi:uncharacterized phage protein (TIGR02220 family)
MGNISDRWIAQLDLLPLKDYAVLTKAILRDEGKPKLSAKYQPIADDIYKQLDRRDYLKMAKHKERESVDVNSMSTKCQQDVNKMSTREEKRAVSPPLPPSSFPSHSPINTPYNPPFPEKKEEITPSLKSPPTPQKPPYQPPNAIYAEIVQYLNRATGSNYHSGASATRTLIHARLAEGFTVEDFKTVIDAKTKEWQGTEFEKFLRPLTLFGTKFESYLNGKQNTKKPGKNNAGAATEKEIDEFMQVFNGGA